MREFGTEETFNAAETEYIALATLDSTHVVVVYKDDGGSGWGCARVGVISGNSITWGTESVFNSAATKYISVAALDSTHFVVAYEDDGGSDYGCAKVGLVSGNTISSYGSENVFNGAVTTYISVAALDSTHFVVVYRDGGNSNHGSARIGLVSGTTISSYGVEDVFNAASTYYISVDVLDSTHFVVAYVYLGTSWRGTAIVGLVSGTTISSFGAENVFNSAITYHISVAALDSIHFVVAYRDEGNLHYGPAIVGLVSGTTISSYGDENVFNTATTNYIVVAKLDSTHFVVAYRDVGNSSAGMAIVGRISGTKIVAYDTARLINALSTSYTTVIALDSNNYVVCYNDDADADTGCSRVWGSGMVFSATLPTYSIDVTNLNGFSRNITDDVRTLETCTVLSSASDTFSFELLNDGGIYSFIEKGCAIEISTGTGSRTKKIAGYITDVERTLDEAGIKPTMIVSGEDGGIRLNHIFFSGRFYDIEVSALIKAILDATDNTTGKTYRTLADVDVSDTYIDETTYSLDEAIYNWRSLGDAINELAETVGFEWYLDTDKALHFYNPLNTPRVGIIADEDLEGNPVITEVGDIVNRAIVIGGYQQTEDQDGNTQTTIFPVKSDASKNQRFTPTENYLSSVLVYTSLVPGSSSDITISIQGGSSTAPDGTTLSNGHGIVKIGSIVDGGYTECRFKNSVTVTPGEYYWIVLYGTTTGPNSGVNVGVDGGGVLDFVTRYPVQVAIMANDNVSQEQYGMYTQVIRDSKIEDSQYAETKANTMLTPTIKKSVSLVVRGDSLKAGDSVFLLLWEVGIEMWNNMKIMSSTQTLGDVFIYNALELEER